jgi:SAM-dependent methyltransferase|tara:strand:+ start:55 stop:831 length:777 start_codon:yes stop_codon:yes gene_type:complete
MNHINEAKNPDPGHLKLVDELVVWIEKNQPRCPTFFSNFAVQQRVRIAHDLAMVENYFTPNQKLLDVASLPFLLSGTMHRLGYDIRAVDLAPERMQETVDHLGLKAIRCDIERETLPFEDESLDGIIFNIVFEHMRIDLIHTLGEMHRVVKKGGTLLLCTPNALSFSKIIRIIREGRLGPDIYRQYSYLKTVGHMGHVREYTVVEVTDFLEKMGFTILNVIHRSLCLPPQGRMAMVADVICRIFPRFKPLFTIVAVKT